MKKTLKRSLSLILMLVMVFSVVPVSAFAASKKQLTVVVNNAPIRKSPKQEGKVLERCAKGKTLEYTRFRINSKI